MSKKLTDYQKVIEYIKVNSPCFTVSIHRYLLDTFGLTSNSARSIAITKLVRMGFIERDKDFPNTMIHYVGSK